MTTPIDEPLWKRIYKSHPLNRAYALTTESERDIEILWLASGQNREPFFDAIETLSGSYGLNVLRPPQRAKWEPPPPRLDARGRELANPYLSPHRNREEQKAIELVDPELAAHLKASAENPWTYQLKRDADEAARLRWNAANEKYDDASNVFRHGSKADQAAVIRKCQEEGTSEKLEVFQREIAPVSVRLFGPLPTQNRNVLHQIGHDGNGKLLKIILAGQERQKALDLAEAAKAEARRAEDVRNAERQQRAHADLMKGVRRLPDGRIVTMLGTEKL